MLANLLDNARRHTPDGGTVTVTVGRGTSIGTESSARGTSIATVTVSDTGPGVGEADRERIFERLVRLDDARSADAGGAGLGLAIARAHGGELACVDPATGAGAAFRLDLPGAAGEQAAP